MFYLSTTVSYYFRNIPDLQSNWCNQISIRRHDVLCQLCVDFLLVPAPSAVLFEVGLHLGIGDGGGRELLLALGALCCLLRLVILWWLCCCCCCCCGGGGGGPLLAFGGFRSAFFMMPSELVTMLIIKMIIFTCPCTFCKL